MMDILNNRLIKTELVEWKKLIPFQPDNLKKTEPHKLQKLANSLCQNGFSMNFYVWEKDGQILIIDGHSRHEVLQLLESGAIYPKNPDGKEYAVTIPDKLPCSFLHLKNKTEAKKAVLIYNSKYKNIDSDILAEWVSDLNLDELKSQIEIPELKLDFDMPQELENDSIDDTAKIKTDIKLGDLIEIGRHRLLCGDSTKKEDVERLMNGEKADMVFTDPPYGVSYTGGHNEKKRKGIENDTLQGGDLTNLFRDSLLNADLFSKDYSAFYIWYANAKAVETFSSFAELNLEVRAVICWYKVKSGLSAFMSQYIPNYEPCIYAFKKGKTCQWFGATDEKTVWELKKESRNDYHPTQKPVELPERAIKNSSKLSDVIYDCFLGSGSTMVASHQLKRKCYGMELEPLYCQVIINRMRKNFPELEIKVNGTEYKES
jgi:DNA modification methylase